MTQYLLSVHMGNTGVREAMSEEDMREGFDRIASIEAEMKSSNALVFSGRLEDSDGARVVRPSKGRIRMTDGPYAETKEHIGGFYIIDAKDLDAALGWAAKVTVAIDTPIEVRAFADSHGG